MINEVSVNFVVVLVQGLLRHVNINALRSSCCLRFHLFRTSCRLCFLCFASHDGKTHAGFPFVPRNDSPRCAREQSGGKPNDAGSRQLEEESITSMLFGTAEPMEHHRHDIHSVVFVFLTYAKERVNLLSRNINRILEGALAAKHLDITLHIILDGSGTIDTRFLRQLHM